MIGRGQALYPVLLILVPGILWAGSGSSGSSILNMAVGARSIGMGEAYTALADDASSLYWNPAGIALLNQSQASFMYNKFFNDFTYQNAAVAVPVENGGIGASVSYLSYGQITAVDAAGNRTGDVKAYSGVGTLGGAWLGENWSGGFNVKGVQESLADVTATGFATDVGATLIYPKEVLGGTLRGAFTYRNLGNGMKFINQTDPFPREWRLGIAAVQMVAHKLNLSMDYGKERERDGAVYTGAEFWPLSVLALRAGYAGANAEGSGLRVGLGLRYKDISFDYAFSNYGILGASHRYELAMRFGTFRSRLTREERELLRRAKLAMAQGRYGQATELFDALIQMEPNYRPAHRLVKVAMAHYEKDERAGAEPFSNIQVAQPVRREDIQEATDLENLLRSSDENMARAAEEAPKSVVQEKP